MVGNRCHFHSFYDTPGWHGSKFTLIFSKFRFLFECRACVSVSGHCLFLYFQIHTVYPVTPNAGMFYNAGINTYGAEIHKVRKHAIHAFPSFLYLILLFRLYIKEPFSEIMERQNIRLVQSIDISDFIS